MKIQKTNLLIGFFTLAILISGGMVISDFMSVKNHQDDLIINTNKNIIDELDKLEENKNNKEIETKTDSKEEKNMTDEEKKNAAIEKIKKRYSLRAIVIKGDFYNKENEPDKAIEKYVEAHNALPDDETITKKIADLYFEEKNYKKAYEYYFKIKDEDNVDLDRLVLSLIYSEKLDNLDHLKNIAYIVKEDIPLNKDGKFYYMNSLACLSDFHMCKKNFNTYFEKSPEINYDKLQKIKDTIKQYQDFQSGELYYKDTLLTAVFFENGIYPLSAKIGEEILEKKPNYQSIMQIIGKSYFEMQEYEKARSVLEQSYELDPSNSKISYLLGIINFNLDDYENSTLYYNAALKSGYSPKEDLERRLAYNYYILGDTTNMLSTFGYLLEEENANIQDYSLGIYHAILDKKNTLALKWANNARQKFPEEELFYGYLGWVYRELGNFDMALDLLNTGFEKNSRNPLITLNLGYLYETEKDYENAEKYFKRTYLINSSGEFGELAQKELENIENFTNK